MTTTATTQLLLVTCDPGSLFAMWQPVNVPGLGGYRLYLTPPQGTPQTQDVLGGPTQFSWPIDLIGQGGYTLSIAVIVDGEPGPQSTPLPLITLSALVLSMVYDVTPAAQLGVLWRAVTQNGVTGYVVVLSDGAGGQWTQRPSTPQTTFTQTLHTTKTYQVTIRASGSGGVVQGPVAGPLTAITAGAQMLSMVYDVVPATQLTLLWRAVTQPAVSGYVVVLDEVGTSNQWVATPAAPTTQFLQSLDSSKQYTATVRATGNGGVVQGPATTPLTAITLPVQMQSMAYSVSPAASLALIWEAVRQAAVSGYVVVLDEVGTSNQWSQTPATPQTEFQQTLDPTQTYQATVRATGSSGVVQGPAIAPLTAITATPALSLLDYNPNTFIVSWNTVSAATIAGYEITIADSSSTSRYPAGNSGQSTLPVTLDASLTYSVVVRAVDASGIVRGPPSPSLAPLLTGPTSPTLTYTGTAFSSSWTRDQNPAATGYLAQLLRNGANADQSTPAAPPAVFNDSFDSGAVYASWVRSTGTKVRGPWTQQAPGPYRSTATLTYDGLGRVKKIARANAVTTDITFDLLGNIRTVVDSSPPAGH